MSERLRKANDTIKRLQKLTPELEVPGGVNSDDDDLDAASALAAADQATKPAGGDPGSEDPDSEDT